ncbi:MAG: thioesterase family protein [Bryobacteraceae bacterium]|nr:thioesterase family protein [Bryobacteraceae bacterium]
MTRFEIEIEVQPKDIDSQGHVNNVQYLRWVQDVAVAHWKAAASPEDQEALTWVVVRHEIDYRRPAYVGERLILKTWVGLATRLRFERLTEILRPADGVVVAEARSLYCPISRASGKPTAVRPEVRAFFSVG